MSTNANDFRVMRTAFTLHVLICLFVPASHAQPFRVATWQLPDVPYAKGVTNPSAVGPDQAENIAATLGGLDADAIIIYGISDGQVLKRIGEAMKPKKHSVALHAVFHHRGSKGPIVGEPMAILSPHQRMHSKTFNWADSGRIDYPGGFGFATFKQGASVVAIYVAGLPGSLTNLISSGERDYFSHKREYAAQYMIAHIGWLASTYTNAVFATYLTGDINPGPKRTLKDDCVGILEKAGFRTFLLGASADKSSVSVTNNHGLDRVLDPVFTKSVEFIASRQIGRAASEHPIVICDLTLKAPGVAAVAAPPAKKAASASKPVSVPEPPKPLPVVAPLTESTIPLASSAVTPAQDKKPAASGIVPPAPATPGSRTASSSAPSSLAATAPPAASVLSTAEIVSPGVNWPLLHERWFGPVMAAAGAALMAAVFFFAHATRRRQAPLALTPRPGDAVFVEIGSIGAQVENPSSGMGERALVSEATTSTDNAHNLHQALWRTPRNDFGNQEHADPVRAGLMAHLRRLMREKLFVWLSHQRNQLIDSHETGTRQVLGLEERLEKIKEQFQDRLISQEERIAEMDKELQAKEKLIRDTMKVKDRQEERQSNSR
jgi:hypothetical protein